MIRENGKFHACIAYKATFFIALILVSANSFLASADEINFLKIASSLEQKLLIKNDIIESLNIGVSQLEKACDLEKDKDENSLGNKNQILKQVGDKKQRLDEFTQEVNVSINLTRDTAIKTIRKRCSIFGQIMGTRNFDKQLCESTKNKIEFIDRLKPNIEKNMKLDNLEFNTLSSLFEMESLGCTSTNFSKKIYGEMQSVLEPLDASIENELKKALKTIE